MEAVSSSSNANDEERCDLAELVDDLLDAESGVFRLTHWGQRSFIYSRGSPQHVRELQENGHGLYVLRHGKCMEEIHDYFRKFESRKCCLGLVGGQNIRTRLRLVNSDSFANNVEIGIDVASPTSAYASQVDLRLSDEEYRVYKCALWCAVCPLLTAQKPPDDASPPLELPEEPSVTHDSAQRLEKLSFSSVHSAATPECGTCDGQLISSDIMRDVLRRAFGLNKHLELYYLKLGYKFHKIKNDAQILAEDLCYQLSLLEKNTHPYYNLNSFLSRRSYEIWRHSTRRHLMELMNKFWCSTMPPVGDVAKFDANNIHSDYRMLLHKLLRLQRLQYSNDPSTVTFAVVPSGATCKILMEFSLRYGIDDLYHQATYLEYLTLNFGIEKEFINLVTQTVRNIRSLLPPDKSKALLVRQQVDQLKSCIDLLLRRCEHLFSHIQTVFLSTNCNNSIGSLIMLLEEIVLLHGYLFGSVESEAMCAEQMLKGYLEVNFQLVYIDHKMSALSDVTGQGQEGSQLSPRVINRIMSCLRDDLADYRTNYEKLFKKYLNITELASVALYELLMKDVLELCERLRTQNERAMVNFGMVGLAYRLNMLDQDLKEFIPLNKQTWRQAYGEHVTRWVSALYHQVESFLLSAVAQDQFFPLHIPRKLSEDEGATEVVPDTTALFRSRSSAFSIVTSSPQQAQESCNREESEIPVNELAPDEDNSQSCPAETPIVLISTPEPSDTVDGTLRAGHSQELLSANQTGIVPLLDNTPVSDAVINNAVPDTGGVNAASGDILPSSDKTCVSSYLTVAIGESVTKVAEVESASGAVVDDGQLSRGACQSDDVFPAVISVVPASGEDVPSVNTAYMSCIDNVPCSTDVTSMSKDFPSDEVIYRSDITVPPSDKDPVTPVMDSATPSLGEVTVLPDAASSIPVSADVMPSVSSETSAMPTVLDAHNMSAAENSVDGLDADVLSVAAVQALSKESLSDSITQVLQTANDIPGSGDIIAVPGEKPLMPATDNKTRVPKETDTLTGNVEDVQEIGTSSKMTEQICVAEVIGDNGNLEDQEKKVLDGGESVCTATEANRNLLDAGESHLNDKEATDDVTPKDHGPVLEAPGKLVTERNSELVLDKDAKIVCEGLSEEREGMLDTVVESELEHDADSGANISVDSQVQLEFVRDSSSSVKTTDVSRQSNDASVQLSDQSNDTDKQSGNVGVQSDHAAVQLGKSSELSGDGSLESDGASKQLFDSSRQLNGFKEPSDNAWEGSKVTETCSGGMQQRSCTGSSSDGEEDDSESSSGSLPELKLVGCLTDGVNSDTVTSVASQVNVPRPVHLLKPNVTSRQDITLQQPGEAASIPVTRMRFDQLNLDSSRHDRRVNNRRSVTVLVTSSVIDVLCLLQRLTYVVETLGGALYCPQFISQKTGDGEMENKMTELRTNLKERLAEMLQKLVCLYAKNLLAMDLCAISQKTANSLMGNQLIEDLIQSRASIWGCRHKLSGADCMQYVNRHEEFRDSRYEPLTKEMCLRINDLSQLCKTLRIIFEKSDSLWSSTSADEAGSPLISTEEYMNKAADGLINILVYRMQLFVVDFLKQLVMSQLPSENELETTLQPMKSFLTEHIKSLRRWLCPENYFAFLDRLWLSLSWCFEKCALDIQRNPTTYSGQFASRLLQTIVIVIRLITNLHLTDLDRMMIQHMDPVLYWLQLYSLSTSRLISIYRLLCLKNSLGDWGTLFPDGCNHETFERMRRDLHSNRKCFKGQQLVDWIASHPLAFQATSNHLDAKLDDVSHENVESSLPSDQGTGRCAFDLAQVFVDTGLVLPAESSSPPSCYSSTSIISDPYPCLVFCGTIKQVHGEVTNSVESSSVPHDQTQLNTDNCSSSHAVWTNWSSVEAGTVSGAQGESGTVNGAQRESGTVNGAQGESGTVNGAQGESGTVNGAQGESGSVSGGAVLSSNVLPSVPPVESSLNSTSGSVENGSLNFHPNDWYHIPSPDEIATTIDSTQAWSASRVQELRQCLQFFATKRLKKGMILSVLVSRKQRDALARQLIVSLPRNVISKYPWMYVREQTVLACLGLRV